MDLSSFIPIDRRCALAQGNPLPEQSSGAVLFADLSGFTPLTEAYAQALGPQRGAEEMTALLNRIFSALIEHIHNFHGSVVGFSGDAITCWFAGDTGLQAATAALALQATAAQFASQPQLLAGPAPLALKCTIAAGPARRLLVGDPSIQVLDVLAGPPISRAGQLEEHAERGDVLLDAGVMHALADAGPHGAWRALAPGDNVFALAGLERSAEPLPWPHIPLGALSAERIRPWLLPAVWKRLRHSDSEFLTELRPAVALFACFAGIDDTHPKMHATLTAYVAWVQRLLARHGGSLLQLTIGDKGSYFYAAFGAPVAHSDDAARAVAAAAALLVPPPDLAFIRNTQIGLAAGAMRAGTYGEASRQTYGALGDAANLGARLMQFAQPGQVLATEDVCRAAGPHVRWVVLPPVTLKGKAQPVPVRQLATDQVARQIGQLELAQRGTLVGRVAERARLEAQLHAARRGQGKVVAVTGEAGQGKSRLAAEMVRSAQDAGFQVYGGAAESSGRQSPFLAWRPIWRALLGLPEQADLATGAAVLAAQLGNINPETLPRLPLIGPLLGLPIPETRLTAEMDAPLRAASLEALLIDCLRAIARQQPVLLVLEDCHWLDAQSLDLLIAIARAIADHPIALLLAYRHDPDAPRLRHVERLPHSMVLHLGALASADAEALLRERFGVPADPALVQQIVERAEGNPFFLEELSSYVLEHGATNQPIELPTSLQHLLIARVDQLGEPARLLLKVASVIGRRFMQSELWGVYPQLGPAGPVASELDSLDRQELILREQQHEQVYLFKHQMTREAVYASLPQTIRARLHEQFAAWLETTRPPDALPLDLLAYHYSQSSNPTKQRQYYRLAGDAAARSYAHTIAAEYYEHLLELIEPAAQPAVLIDLGHVQTRAGNWDEAAARYASALAHTAADPERGAALAGLGRVRRLQGALGEAETQLLEAKALFTRLGNAAGITETLQDLARIYRVQGDYERVAQAASDSEHMAHEANDLLGVAQARTILGRAAFDQGDYVNANSAYEQALDLFRVLDAQPELPHALLALAMVADAQGHGAHAHRLVEECLLLSRKLGDRPGIVYALGSLGMIALNQADYATAQARAEESLMLVRELGDQHGIVIASTNLGLVALSDGRWEEAASYYRATLRLALELGYPTQAAIALVGLAASQVGGAGGPGQLAQGVRWLSAAASYVADLGIMLERLERDALDQARVSAQEALPPAKFAAAWMAGTRLGLEQASAEALAATVGT